MEAETPEARERRLSSLTPKDRADYLRKEAEANAIREDLYARRKSQAENLAVAHRRAAFTGSVPELMQATLEAIDALRGVVVELGERIVVLEDHHHG